MAARSIFERMFGSTWFLFALISKSFMTVYWNRISQLHHIGAGGIWDSISKFKDHWLYFKRPSCLSCYPFLPLLSRLVLQIYQFGSLHRMIYLLLTLSTSFLIVVVLNVPSQKFFRKHQHLKEWRSSCSWQQGISCVHEKFLRERLENQLQVCTIWLEFEVGHPLIFQIFSCKECGQQ